LLLRGGPKSRDPVHTAEQELVSMRFSALRRLAAVAAVATIGAGASLISAQPAAAAWYPWQHAGAAQAMTQAAADQRGLSYCWGGGDANGPTYGNSDSNCRPDTGTGKGFDCSGLVHYALAKAGRNPGDKTAHGYADTLGWVVTQPQPGDLLFWDWTSNGSYDHVGIYLGRNNDNGVMEFVEASGDRGLTIKNGKTVKISRYNGAHLIKRVF
jgi:cell wall-associated NlpC family hydrolase